MPPSFDGCSTPLVGVQSCQFPTCISGRSLILISLSHDPLIGSASPTSLKACLIDSLLY